MSLKTTLVGVLLLLPTILLAELDSTPWRIVEFSSENVLTGETATCAIDNNPETQWHTRWHAARDLVPATPPHSITIDFRATHPVTALRYRSRAHGEGGLPRQYLVELGTSLDDWTTVAQGELQFRSRFSPHAVIVLDKPVSACFLRFTVQSVHPAARAMEPGLVVGELDVATVDAPFIPTTRLPVPASREWSYGGYDWHNRHQDLLAYAAAHKPRLIFLGDSITHRWGAPPYSKAERTGEIVWNKYYTHRNTHNLGYGWDRLENMLWRLQHGELENTDPCLVVVMAGTNNLEVNNPQEIATGIEGLCNEIHQQKPKAKILLLAIFPRGKTGTTPERDQTNQLISNLGERDYVTFKDISKVFLNDEGQLPRDIMPDLLHPNEKGYQLWAQAIEADVAKFLGDELVEP